MELAEPVSTDDPLMDANDEDLAHRAQEGQDAFFVLYDRYVPRVQSYVYAHVTAFSEVDDLVSTVFLRALSRIETYRRDRGTFAAWLFGITRNAVVDHLRTLSQKTASLEEGEKICEQELSPEDTAILRERHAAIRQAFMILTPEQREAVALRYLAEVSYADVGRALHKSEPAAKMLVRRGLLALRSELDREVSK